MGEPSLIQGMVSHVEIDADSYVFLTWDHDHVGGIANLPNYRVDEDHGGVCGHKSRRASITTYGCEYDDDNCERDQHTGRVSHMCFC